MTYKNSIIETVCSKGILADLKKYKVHVFIINFNLADKTVQCLEKLEKQTFQNFWIHLLDNSTSDESQKTKLINYSEKVDNITIYACDQNSGFAVGHNRMFEMVLPNLTEEHIVVLLNNDAFPVSDFLDKLIAPMDLHTHTEMVASRMMRHDAPNEVDNLGNVFYKSGLSSNRLKKTAQILCPCGGAAAYSVRLLNHIKKAHQEIFDEDFFCYVEDTDLGFRALGLGYQCAYAESAVTFHIGSASSGGRFSKFVMVHGLRNSLYFLIKSVPARILLKNIHWIAFLQLAIIFRYLMMGCWKELWQIYSSVIKNTSAFLKKRKSILRTYKSVNFSKYISNQFYDEDYIRNILRNSWWFPFKGILKKNKKG